MSARVLVVDGSTTVRRVVRRTLEEVGHTIEEAGDPTEGLALAQHFVPALVLLDPAPVAAGALDAAGLCRALRGISNLQGVPVVLMTAGDPEAAMEATGASDALRKPFGRDALLTAVAHALEPKNDTGAFEAIGPDDPHRAADAIRTHLADWLVSLVPSAAAAVGAALEELEPDALFAKVEELARRLPDHPEEGELSFHGRLEHVGLGDVLQILQHQGQSGVLVIRSFDGKAISLCLTKGTVDLVLARGTPVDLRLGRYIVAEGLMDEEELAPLLERPGPGLLGRRLMKLGSLTEEELKQALARQSSELVYEALRWPRGTFSFSRFAKRPEAEEAKLGLPMTSMLMEGLRRVDEWRLIEEQIDSFDRVPLVDVDVVRETPRERMQPAERQVLDAVDGRRTIRELIDETHLGAFEVCKVLYQLLGSRLIRLR